MKLETGEQILELVRGYQVSSIVVAAAELDVFNALVGEPRTVAELVSTLGSDPRATAVLLDALASVGLVVKADGRYSLAPALVPFLSNSSPQSVVAMLRHQSNCLRRWARLPWVVRSGKPADVGPGVRGADADNVSFIEAMNVVSSPVAEQLVRSVHPGSFRCVLDVGGGSGTWTLAWLRAEPSARAILFDLPEVIPMARARMTHAGFMERVAFVGGDYNTDALPRGADLAWVSAIVHQNSSQQNRRLFRCIAEAMEPGGRILIRDVVMDESRVEPAYGALFAVNMLVATEGGGTYTLADLRQDLEPAGFADVHLIRQEPGMNSVVVGRLA